MKSVIVLKVGDVNFLFKRILLLIPLLLSVLVLTSCMVMMPSDYIKIKLIIIEDCDKVGLHGKVTITDLHWIPLESPTHYVSYI